LFEFFGLLCRYTDSESITSDTCTSGALGFWFLVCHATTQLATQLRQRCRQVVRSNKEARKRLTESKGTPAKDFGREEIGKRKYTVTKEE